MNAFERKVKIIKELIRFNKNPVFFISANDGLETAITNYNHLE